jgi:hypothetical protein
MKGKRLWGTLSLLAMAALTLQSCKKENGIDNNNVIKKPYVLYLSDARGNIFSTNNGDDYKTVFPGDGIPIRGLITSKQNILMVKDKVLFFSDNGGKSFNPYLPANMIIPTTIPWSYFMINSEDQDRVYITNLMGVGGMSYSQYNGKSFDADTNWKADTPYTAESVTQLDNKKVFVYSLSGSLHGISKLYRRNSKDEPFEPVPTNLPSTNKFYLTHSADLLIATDYEGTEAAWYSGDEGKTFKKYSGLPVTLLYATHAPFGKVILIGTKGLGVYKFDGSSFVPTNSGISPGTSVYSITSKANIYKNDVNREYIFLATSTGIYRSEDMAKSWVKVKTGDHRIVY